jgi:hypothetical protein
MNIAINFSTIWGNYLLRKASRLTLFQTACDFSILYTKVNMGPDCLFRGRRSSELALLWNKWKAMILSIFPNFYPICEVFPNARVSERSILYPTASDGNMDNIGLGKRIHLGVRTASSLILNGERSVCKPESPDLVLSQCRYHPPYFIFFVESDVFYETQILSPHLFISHFIRNIPKNILVLSVDK